jgi:hypothetical protein
MPRAPHSAWRAAAGDRGSRRASAGRRRGRGHDPRRGSRRRGGHRRRRYGCGGAGRPSRSCRRCTRSGTRRPRVLGTPWARCLRVAGGLVGARGAMSPAVPRVVYPAFSGGAIFLTTPRALFPVIPRAMFLMAQALRPAIPGAMSLAATGVLFPATPRGTMFLMAARALRPAIPGAVFLTAPRALSFGLPARRRGACRCRCAGFPSARCRSGVVRSGRCCGDARQVERTPTKRDHHRHCRCKTPG